MEMIISFNGGPESEIEHGPGLTQSVNWDALMPTISKFVMLRPDEMIQGLIVNEIEVRVKIIRKKGRKTKQ